MGDTKPYTSPSKPQITEDGIPDVDLSAIRQQISEGFIDLITNDSGGRPHQVDEGVTFTMQV